MPTDEKYISYALKLAEKAKGKTSPNPMVGAVIVKNGRIIGEGYHKKAGGPHAEIIALKKAGRAANGAVLYGTLEPCCFFARTRPCTDAIIKAGIKKVVLAKKDPNPLNNGKGIKILKKHNIAVTAGVLKKEAGLLNEVFEKYITMRMPFVILKMAQSLDGKIALKSGDSKWISCEASRRYVHRLRNEADAVMAGINTVLKDNPRLGFKKKIIIDSRLRTPPGAKLFKGTAPGDVIIAAGKCVSPLKKRRLVQKGALIIETPSSGRVDLKNLFRELGKKEITSVLVEGGAQIAWSILNGRLADKVLFFVSSKIIGGMDALSSVGGRGINNLKDAIKLKNLTSRKIGEDILIEGYLS